MASGAYGFAGQRGSDFVTRVAVIAVRTFRAPFLSEFSLRCPGCGDPVGGDVLHRELRRLDVGGDSAGMIGIPTFLRLSSTAFLKTAEIGLGMTLPADLRGRGAMVRLLSGRGAAAAGS